MPAVRAGWIIDIVAVLYCGDRQSIIRVLQRV